MNRRNAIKNLSLFTGGMILLPSCDFSDEKVSIVLKKLQITLEQEKLVDAIISTLIPEGNIPGAKSLKVTNFVWIMVDDCMETEKQNSFINGLNLFDAKVKANQNKPFDELASDNRELILNEMFKLQNDFADKENLNNTSDIKIFLNTSKYYTIWGYKQSEYMMTEIMPYKLVPGSYGLCETIDKSKKININA